MTPESVNAGEPGTPQPSGRFATQHRQLGRKSRRAYLKAGALLLLALGAGVAIGVGGTLYYMKTRFRRPPPGADQIGRSVLERLGDTVSLTADEKSRIERIIGLHMANVEKTRIEVIAAISNEFDAMNDQVDEILGTERSEKWESEKRRRYGHFYRGKNERHSADSRRGRTSHPPSDSRGSGHHGGK